MTSAREPRGWAWRVGVGLAACALAAAPAGAAPDDERPWLGVVPVYDNGLWLKDVVTGSPADLAGLRRNDAVLSIDDIPMNTAIDLVNLVAAHQVGDKVALDVVRDGRRLTVTTVLAPRLADADAVDRQWGRQHVPNMLMVQGSDTVVKLPAHTPQLLVWYSPSCDGCGALLAALDEHVHQLAAPPPIRYLSFERGSSLYGARLGLHGPVLAVPDQEFRGAYLLSTVLRSSAVLMTIDDAGVVRQTVLLTPEPPAADDDDARPAWLDEAAAAIDLLLRPRSGKKLAWQ